MISEYINRRDVQNVLSKYYPDAGPTTEQILHNINRDIKNLPDADVVTWEQLKKAWAIATADDVAPVVHGHWLIVEDEDWGGGGKVECSVCHYGYAWDSYFEAEDFKHCPNCGAKMNGGTNDESY